MSRPCGVLDTVFRGPPYLSWGHVLTLGGRNNNAKPRYPTRHLSRCDPVEESEAKFDATRNSVLVLCTPFTRKIYCCCRKNSNCFKSNISIFTIRCSIPNSKPYFCTICNSVGLHGWSKDSPSIAFCRFVVDITRVRGYIK